MNMVELNGLLITPWHPVKVNGVWKFPIDLKPSQPTHIDYVYNLVLSQAHSVFINDVQCITLGHGIIGDEVATHAYFGTDIVLKDLSMQSGWEEGRIVLDNFAVIRDSTTNLVTSIITPLEACGAETTKFNTIEESVVV